MNLSFVFAAEPSYIHIYWTCGKKAVEQNHWSERVLMKCVPQYTQCGQQKLGVIDKETIVEVSTFNIG